VKWVVEYVVVEVEVEEHACILGMTRKSVYLVVGYEGVSVLVF
jgi:hypothetical protein